MGWIEISIEVPGEYTEPMSALFARYADGGVVVEQGGGYSPDEGETGPPPGTPVTVKAFLNNDKTLAFRKAQIDVGIRLFSHIKKLPLLKERLMDEDDWRKQRFDPIRVGRRLVVASPTNTAMSEPQDLVIPVEPGLAFGTGHHPTTQMCLRILEGSIKPGSSVLDVGCGSGILSIAALLLGADSALAIDIDSDAVKASASNAAHAGVVDRLTVLNCTLSHHMIQTDSFDVVIANISAAFLIESACDLLMCLKQNGTFVGSGFMTERNDDVNAAFANIGDAFIESEQCEDWMAILVRPGWF